MKQKIIRITTVSDSLAILLKGQKHTEPHLSLHNNETEILIGLSIILPNYQKL